MDTKDFEIKVLTELASIKEMLKNYSKVEENASEALNKSKKNEEEIKEIKDKMTWLSRAIAIALIGIVIEVIVFVIKMM